jgi:hypothetical protein
MMPVKKSRASRRRKEKKDAKVDSIVVRKEKLADVGKIEAKVVALHAASLDEMCFSNVDVLYPTLKGSLPLDAQIKPCVHGHQLCIMCGQLWLSGDKIYSSIKQSLIRSSLQERNSYPEFGLLPHCAGNQKFRVRMQLEKPFSGWSSAKSGDGWTTVAGHPYVGFNSQMVYEQIAYRNLDFVWYSELISRVTFDAVFDCTRLPGVLVTLISWYTCSVPEFGRVVAQGAIGVLDGHELAQVQEWKTLYTILPSGPTIWGLDCPLSKAIPCLEQDILKSYDEGRPYSLLICDRVVDFLSWSNVLALLATFIDHSGSSDLYIDNLSSGGSALVDLRPGDSDTECFVCSYASFCEPGSSTAALDQYCWCMSQSGAAILENFIMWYTAVKKLGSVSNAAYELLLSLGLQDKVNIFRLPMAELVPSTKRILAVGHNVFSPLPPTHDWNVIDSYLDTVMSVLTRIMVKEPRMAVGCPRSRGRV